MADEKYINTENTEDIGEVKISEEAITTIVINAAMEVEGVTAVSHNIVSDIKGIIARKGARSGVRVAMSGEEVDIDLTLTLAFDVSMPEVAAKVQQSVKNAVESMAGMTVRKVNIRIQAVEVKQQEQ